MSPSVIQEKHPSFHGKPLLGGIYIHPWHHNLDCASWWMMGMVKQSRKRKILTQLKILWTSLSEKIFTVAAAATDGVAAVIADVAAAAATTTYYSVVTIIDSSAATASSNAERACFDHQQEERRAYVLPADGNRSLPLPSAVVALCVRIYKRRTTPDWRH